MQGSPTCSTIPFQSSGNSRFRRLSSCLMPGTYCLLGRTTVFGLATPSFETSDAPKNLSSAVHMNGLLTTVVPASTACLRYERYIGTSCEMRSMMTSYGTGSSCPGAPIFTYSTVTPASRLCTSSMSAGGKDHSRPTMRATRYALVGFAGRFAMYRESDSGSGFVETGDWGLGTRDWGKRRRSNGGAGALLPLVPSPSSPVPPS